MATWPFGWNTAAMSWWQWVPIGYGYGYWECRCLNG